MKPVDKVVLILTRTIAIILITVILGATIRGEPLSETGSKIIGNMSLALIAIISLYVGSKLNRK